MTILRIHKAIHPNTDHGYTWLEYYWFERDGERCSAITPGAGCCERLGHLPGGPLGCPELFSLDCERFQPERTIKTEQEHLGWAHVGTVCIGPITDSQPIREV